MPGQISTTNSDTPRPINLRRRRVFRRLLLAFNLLIWPLLALLVMEGTSRYQLNFIDQHNPYVQANLRRYSHLNEVSSKTLWEVPRERYRKNARLETTLDGQRFEITFNEHGYRTPSIAIPKPQGLLRIVCIGGSTTVEGMTNDSTYPAVLQRRLREHFNTDQIEVVNCGISGFQSIQEAGRMDEYLALEPDMILEYNGVNDICYVILYTLELRAHLWQKLLRQSAFLSRLFGRYFKPGNDLMLNLLYWNTLKNIETIHKTAQQHGVDVMFCSFVRPQLDGITPDELDYFNHNLRTFWERKHTSFAEYCHLVDVYNAAMRQLCSEREMGYIPVAENLTGGIQTFVDICHMTRPGIEKKAEVIFNYLKPYAAKKLGQARNNPATDKPTSGN